MNPQYSFWHNLVIPIAIGLLFFAGYGVYKKNHYIMNPDPYLRHLMDNEAEADVHILEAGSSASEATEASPTTATTETRLSHRMLPAEDINSNMTWQEKNSGTKQIGSSIYAWDENSISLMNAEGVLTFTFRISTTDSLLGGSPYFTKKSIVFATKEGRIYSIHAGSGNVEWYVDRKEPILWNPFLHDGKIFVFVQGKDKLKTNFLVFEENTGKYLNESASFEWGIVGVPVQAADGFIYYSTQNGHLNSINLSDLKLAWSNELASSYKAGPTLSGDRLYTISDDGVLFSFDRQKGKKITDFEIGTTSHSPPHIMESLGYGAVVDVGGYLVTFDIRAGKRIWRYNVHGTGAGLVAGEFVSAFKLVAKTFEQLQFASQSRGMSIWTKCHTNRICLFEPKDGTLLHRIDVKGSVVGPPIWSDLTETLWVPVQETDGPRRFKALKPWKPVEKTESAAPVKTSGDSSSFLTKPLEQPTFDFQFDHRARV